MGWTEKAVRRAMPFGVIGAGILLWRGYDPAGWLALAAALAAVSWCAGRSWGRASRVIEEASRPIEEDRGGEQAESGKQAA